MTAYLSYFIYAAIALFSFSSAEVEQVFNHLHPVKTKLRNCMQFVMANAISLNVFICYFLLYTFYSIILLLKCAFS